MTSKSPLWRQRDFLRLWSAQTVSDVGARITREGLPMMAVMGLAATPSQLGLLAALASGAALVVGLSAGDFVDHTARRPILIGMDLIRGLILIILPIAAWLHLLSASRAGGGSRRNCCSTDKRRESWFMLCACSAESWVSSTFSRASRCSVAATATTAVARAAKATGRIRRRRFI